MNPDQLFRRQSPVPVYLVPGENPHPPTRAVRCGGYRPAVSCAAITRRGPLPADCRPAALQSSPCVRAVSIPVRSKIPSRFGRIRGAEFSSSDSASSAHPPKAACSMKDRGTTSPIPRNSPRHHSPRGARATAPISRAILPASSKPVPCSPTPNLCSSRGISTPPPKPIDCHWNHCSATSSRHCRASRPPVPTTVSACRKCRSAAARAAEKSASPNSSIDPFKPPKNWNRPWNCCGIRCKNASMKAPSSSWSEQ